MSYTSKKLTTKDLINRKKMTHIQVESLLEMEGVKLRHKSESKLMKFLSFFLGKRFMTSFWTTLSTKTIWCPEGTRLDRLDIYEDTIRHEMIHVVQMRKWGLLFHISYILLPLPFGLSWCRWRWEREAYLVQLKKGNFTIDQVVNLLWSYYGLCWPRSLMRKWFNKALH